MDPLHHHHAPLHWGYTGTAVAHPHPYPHSHSQHNSNTWLPPGTNNGIIGGGGNMGHGIAVAGNATSSSVNTSMTSSRKLKRAMSESDCEDLYSEESSKEQ